MNAVATLEKVIEIQSEILLPGWGDTDPAGTPGLILPGAGGH